MLLWVASVQPNLLTFRTISQNERLSPLDTSMLSQRRKKTKSINTNNIKPQLSKYIWSNKMCTFFSNLVNWFQSIDDLSFLTLEVFKWFFPPYILCYLSELVMLLLTLATTATKHGQNWLSYMVMYHALASHHELVEATHNT